MATKDELLQKEDEAWSALIDAVGRVPFDRRDDEGVVPGWSVKDLVWHSGYWAGFVAQVLERLAANQPAPDDQDWDAINDAVARESKAMSWEDVIVGATGMRDKARAALQAMPELTDEAVSEFADETFSHYDEHRAEIAAFADTL
jgi:Mycothiol maleylpyruvate isomerase N-terminal domain